MKKPRQDVQADPELRRPSLSVAWVYSLGGSRKAAAGMCDGASGLRAGCCRNTCRPMGAGLARTVVPGITRVLPTRIA